MQNELFSASALNLARGASSPVVAELQTYLSRFGWLRTPDQAPVVTVHDELPLVKPGLFDDATETALSEFQQFYGLKVTGRLDADTLALMRKPRCGFPDKPPVPRGNGAVNEFALAPTRWDKRHLGFHVSKGTSDLSEANVHEALRLAYRKWCLVSQMEVHPAGGGAEIDVRFATRDHGDGAPFDGPGNVLAHAFFPPFPGDTGIAGDLHFDDDETWTRNLPPSGIDLDTVALHEAGHTLGLAHTSDASAAMFAIYGGPRRNLATDDVNGIRAVYGTRGRNPWTDIDAAVDGRLGSGKAYFFRGGEFLRYDYKDDLPDPGYAQPIAGNWPGLPPAFTSGIEAAVNGQRQFTDKLYFFKGGQYVRYDWPTGKVDPGYPKPVAGNWPGLPADFASGIDAAVSGPRQFPGKLYLFKGGQYVSYDWAADRADSGYPKPIAGNWHGLPDAFSSGIQAALNGQESFFGKLYLFKGADFVRFDWDANKMDAGYPHPIVPNWL